MNIDYESLRNDLLDYFGTAMSNGYPMAIVEFTEVEHASNEELIDLAQKNNFNLSNYIVEEPKEYKLIP